jgi:hypothetical protein
MLPVLKEGEHLFFLAVPLFLKILFLSSHSYSYFLLVCKKNYKQMQNILTYYLE